MVPYLVPEPVFTHDSGVFIRKIVGFLNAILPVDDDQETFDHLKLAFATDGSQQSTWEFLKLTVYLLSNKLLLDDHSSSVPTRTKDLGNKLLTWFQAGNNQAFLRAVIQLDTPSINTFTEFIFCSAVQVGAISMIQLCLESGTDPDTFVEHDGDSLTPLQLAAATGNIEMAQILLKYRANTTATDTREPLVLASAYVVFSQTPLQIAARMGHTELVRILLSAGAPVNTKKSFWSSALQNAAKGQHYEIALILLDAGAYIDGCYGFYGSALACAIEEKFPRMINLFLSRNADVNCMGPSGITSLQSAAMVDDEAMVRQLLSRGADVNFPLTSHTRLGPLKTALQWAVINKNKNIAYLLLQAGENIDRAYGELPDDDWESLSQTTLAIAVERCDYEMVELLLNAGISVNDCRGEMTALETAVKSKDYSMISLLLSARADPSSDNSMTLAARASDIAIMSMLLRNGAKINSSSRSWPTALCMATINGDLHTVQFLVNHGADPNIGLEENHLDPMPTEYTYALGKIRDDWDDSHSVNCFFHPLQIAACEGDLELLKYLIAAKANINHPASGLRGRTALQTAVENQHIPVVCYLLENGADINAPAGDRDGFTALQAAILQDNLDLTHFLLINGANPDDQPSEECGGSAIQCAALGGKDDLVRRLAAAGAQVNGRCSEWNGFFAIQAAAINGHVTTVKLLLHELGADINAPACYRNGYTALQAAVSKGNTDLMEILLENGADVNAPGSIFRTSYVESGTALEIAARKGYIRIAKRLIEQGASLLFQGTMPALTEAASKGRLDMVKMLIVQGLSTSELSRSHLKEAFVTAKEAGHTAVAKYLEAHQITTTISYKSITEAVG